MGEYELLLRGMQARSIVDPTKETELERSQEARAGPSFEEILAAKLPAGSVKISTEAKAAMDVANIDLAPMELDRLGLAIDRLSEAGGRQGLLLGEKAAFVVDVPNRLVTTATPREDIRDHVFTDIDSVTLID